MRKLIADFIVKPFKKMGIFGRQRFWLLYWAYRITGWHIRHKEWDFVLEYLPPLGKWQKVSILDVGCARNLIGHEFKARGYSLRGIDLERYQERKYPGVFWQRDICDTEIPDCDFVTCISVFEHIPPEKQQIALECMIACLKIGGRLLLTIPTEEFAQGHPWKGFKADQFRTNSGDCILRQNARVIEYTEKAGQICLAIARVS